MVAQIFNLLYRRIAFQQARRYSSNTVFFTRRRLKIHDTAD